MDHRQSANLYIQNPGEAGEFELLGSIDEIVLVTQEATPPSPTAPSTIGTGSVSFSAPLATPKGWRKKLRSLWDPRIDQRNQTKSSYLRRMQRGPLT